MSDNPGWYSNAAKMLCWDAGIRIDLKLVLEFRASILLIELLPAEQSRPLAHTTVLRDKVGHWTSLDWSI
jgi:hypothetical protein